MRVYVEYGLPYGCSTEWECPMHVEQRMQGKHVPDAYVLCSMYVRVQIGHIVLVLDGKHSAIRHKPYSKCKLVLGFGYKHA
jgi:hypothetical protein